VAKNKEKKKKERERLVAQKKHQAAIKKRAADKVADDQPKTRAKFMAEQVAKPDNLPTPAAKTTFTQRRGG
jgi:hypothetical protein